MTEIWLDGDHYKWRALRANGVPVEKPATLLTSLAGGGRKGSPTRFTGSTRDPEVCGG